MKPILEVHNISKKYRIQHQTGGYLSLRERMVNALKFEKKNTEDFWALNGVSFTVNPGESIGIIGSNGAGKSTLLKILSKITPPTKGRIVSRGRIASLLEVGTGFHPELTGRENIYFNGSLLGMKRSEIDSKFDEIVDFSGVEIFLDTPLKHFSSGMQLRLAFAVAAFLEPEILIIDEVLAVGDAEFQKKCMGKMEDVSKNGRTILFVSHNLDAVEALCKSAILLKNGAVVNTGVSKDVVAEYIKDNNDRGIFKSCSLSTGVTLTALSFTENKIDTSSSLNFRISLEAKEEEFQSLTDLCLLFYNYKHQRVCIYDLRKYFQKFFKNDNSYTLVHSINNFNLTEGTYSVGLYYGVLGSEKRDLLNLTSVEVKGRYMDEAGFRPYDVQYRGYIDLV